MRVVGGSRARSANASSESGARLPPTKTQGPDLHYFNKHNTLDPFLTPLVVLPDWKKHGKKSSCSCDWGNLNCDYMLSRLDSKKYLWIIGEK